jgi:hypothetical protein
MASNAGHCKQVENAHKHMKKKRFSTSRRRHVMQVQQARQTADTIRPQISQVISITQERIGISHKNGRASWPDFPLLWWIIREYRDAAYATIPPHMR